MTAVTQPTTAELADSLDRAADVLQANGWHRGSLYSEESFIEQGTPLADCPACALGAINIAVCGQPLLGLSGDDPVRVTVLADAAAIAVAHHLNVGTTPRDLARWNDELERTIDDVVQAFRDTAAELRAEAAA